MNSPKSHAIPALPLLARGLDHPGRKSRIRCADLFGHGVGENVEFALGHGRDEGFADEGGRFGDVGESGGRAHVGGDGTGSVAFDASVQPLGGHLPLWTVLPADVLGWDSVEIGWTRLVTMVKSDMLEKPVSTSVPGWPEPMASDVLRDHALTEVRSYLERRLMKADLQLFATEEMERWLEQGSLTFGGTIHLPPPVDLHTALKSVEEAFIDGVVLMFADGKRVEKLDEILSLSDSSRIRYIRLTSLRGC